VAWRPGLVCLVMALTSASPVRGTMSVGAGAGLVATDPCPTVSLASSGLVWDAF